jgi:hypothetical protein
MKNGHRLGAAVYCRAAVRGLPGFLFAVVLLASALSARAASYTTNNFDNSGDEQGWFDPGGLLSVSQVDGAGNPNTGGALVGTFEEGGPKTDSFRYDTSSGTDFTGSYGGLAGFSGWEFQFLADDILPQDLIFRFRSVVGMNTYDFFRIVTLDYPVLAIDTWYSMFVDTTSYSGWNGSGAANFAAALGNLGNVTRVEIEVTSGAGPLSDFPEQSFRVDNFGTRGGAPAGPGGAVPEPGTLALYSASLLGLLILRRRRASASS